MNYYARIIQEKRNEKKGPKLFQVLNETFDISTQEGFKKASDAINRHHKEVTERAERDLEKAMSMYEFTKSTIDKWKAEIGNKLLKESRVR